MKYLTKQICFQEVPDEVSLSFLITGCQMRCKGCHSPEAWNIKLGTELDLEKEIEPYKGMITCVLFLGGEWEEEELIKNLKIVKDMGLKTCLYTGLDLIALSPYIGIYLDYLKVGPYIEKLGGLDNPKTNQRMFDLDKGKDITYLFHKNNTKDVPKTKPITKRTKA